jgi:hypothetical protein
MVLRKEVGDSNAGLIPAPLSKANPPYPITPLSEHPPAVPTVSSDAPYSPDLNKSPAFNFKTLEDAKVAQKTRQDDDSDFSDDEWDRSDDDDFEEVNAKDVPDALKPAGGKVPPKNSLPDALRPGPPAGVPIKRPLNTISPMPTGASSASFGAASNASEHSNSSLPLQTNNPYLKMQPTGQSNWGGESSQQVWGDAHGEAAELPAFQTPTTPSYDFAKLTLGSNVQHTKRTPSPDQPPLIAVESPTPHTSPLYDQPGRDSIVSNPWNPGMDVSSLDAASRAHGLPEGSQPTASHGTWQDQQDWERRERERRQQEAHAAQAAAVMAERERSHEEEYHRLEQAQSTNPFTPAPPPTTSTSAEEQAPPLPPRRSHEDMAPFTPLHTLDTGVGSASTPGPESPNTQMNRQRKEHYQIKHIRWHDVNKPGIRTSPILTQNLNGPCPLLALVNALVLSTPAGIETALVETLRTREQVSLGLLLDAVFDELMSGRRGTAAQELPDVSDLYKFLLALHTGLNVNPMFVPDADAAHGHTALTSRAGAFENTLDMKLYRTFNIPLMHGWLPEADSEAYDAFNRVAKSYETSQYVQFQEEELDAKLQSGEPLTADEQQMFTDIHSIKEFLGRWPTQLTDYGLKVMRDSFQPGQVAILFRNDHFSTLFKDPRTNKLLTLVTDQGYSGHDEIVWESLVDVNGQGSELFSGDFRSVENNNMPAQQSQGENFIDTNGNHGWTTVQSRRGNQQGSASAPGPSPETAVTSAADLSRAEQEDHDLALALQLQEEEEDRERRGAAQRERDNQASVTAIAAQSQARPNNRRTSRGEVPPVIPPRRNNITTHRPTNEPAPPPTYEEASTIPAYVPPQGHPASTQAPFPPQGSAYQASAGSVPLRRPIGRPMPSHPSNPPGRIGRRQSAGNMAPNVPEERERCIVM